MERTKQENPEAAWMINRLFPSMGDLLAMLGIFFAAQIAVGLFGALILLFTGQGVIDLDPIEKGRFVALTSLVSLLAALFLIWRYRRWRKAEKVAISISPKGLNPLLLVWAYLLMFSTTIVLEPLYEWLPTPDQDPGRGWWAFLALVVIAPVFEEWICRGVVFGALKKRYGVVVSMLLSALFFGLLHVQPVPVVNAFVLGLILAYIYHKTNTLLAPILLHALHNGVAYLLITAGYGEASFIELLGGRQGLYTLLYIGAVTLSVVSLYAIWCSVQQPKPLPGVETEPLQGDSTPTEGDEIKKIDPEKQ